MLAVFYILLFYYFIDSCSKSKDYNDVPLGIGITLIYVLISMFIDHYPLEIVVALVLGTASLVVAILGLVVKIIELTRH